MIPAEDLMDLLISRCANRFTVGRSVMACSFYIKNPDSVDVYFLDPDRPGCGFKIVLIDRESIIYLLTERDSMVWNHGDTVSVKWVRF
jgi:hypothetical protein